MSGTIDNGQPNSGVDVADVLELFGNICDRTSRVLAETTDWSESGRRAGQYRVDLDVDEACVTPILRLGYAVLSEETGLQQPADGDSAGVVVVDPLDGSTNASLGLPWCNTALCLAVDGVPEVAMVANLVTGDRFHATRGGGAFWQGGPITVSAATELAEAVVAVNGWPPRHMGWRQFRAMGSAELDICNVARGGFDAYVDMTHGELGVWDYLAGMLILTEAGGVMVDAFERELVVLDHEARRAPVAASCPNLLDELVRARHADL